MMQMKDLFVNLCEGMRLALLKIVDTYLLAVSCVCVCVDTFVSWF